MDLLLNLYPASKDKLYASMPLGSLRNMLKSLYNTTTESGDWGRRYPARKKYNKYKNMNNLNTL